LSSSIPDGKGQGDQYNGTSRFTDFATLDSADYSRSLESPSPFNGFPGTPPLKCATALTPPDTIEASKRLSQTSFDTLPDIDLTNSNILDAEKNYDSTVDDVVMADVSLDDVAQTVINDKVTSDTAMSDDVAEELETTEVMMALECGVEKRDEEKSYAGSDGHLCNTAQDQSIVPILKLPNFQNHPSATEIPKIPRYLPSVMQ